MSVTPCAQIFERRGRFLAALGQLRFRRLGGALFPDQRLRLVDLVRWQVAQPGRRAATLSD